MTREVFVKCPVCKREIPVKIDRNENRFTMPIHGKTVEMTCNGGNIPMRIVVKNRR